MFDRYLLAKQQQNYLIPIRASHHNTPLYPLSRGETSHSTHSLPTKSSIQISPLERGRGYVTYAHRHLNQKQPPKANRHHLTKQQQNHLNPPRVSHRNTPLYPLSRGETTHPIHSLPTKNSIQISPLERGRGCVTPAHSLPNQKQPPEANRYFRATLNTRNTTSPNNSKIISNQPASLTVTHPFIPYQEGKPHTQSTHYQQGTSITISPLERGRGCVTPAHSLL